ncbi:CbtA family protein [Mesorhizobium xinjiangense]|uniref:CbtA family protein n=1 Tax=Mesorhizobium xinjiangense TaxID=2678685 RepID=UPI0012EE0A6A|nr:CbtA family protein [Mesorhizobium xinjiangense]
MNIFRNVVFVAAIAGLLAGLVMTALQAYATVPLILEAETYESAGAGAAGHDHGEAAAGHSHDGAAAGHSHGGEAWAPADGFERSAYTALANIVTGIGFALLLVAVSEMAGGIANWRQGLFWGFAGFATFTLAPGLGLPPELPGMPAADLGARQVWWVATVAATAAGLALIALRRSAILAVIGVAVIVAPHIVGAPQPASHDTAVPAELHHSFVVAVTLTSLVFWLLLGAVAGALRGRFFAGTRAPQGSLA